MGQCCTYRNHITINCILNLMLLFSCNASKFLECTGWIWIHLPYVLFPLNSGACLTDVLFSCRNLFHCYSNNSCKKKRFLLCRFYYYFNSLLSPSVKCQRLSLDRCATLKRVPLYLNWKSKKGGKHITYKCPMYDVKQTQKSAEKKWRLKRKLN